MKKNEPRFKIPHVQVLIAALLVITALASVVLPAGSYERDERGRVVAGSFQYDSAETEGPERPRGWALLGAVLTAPLEGIVAASSVIAFLLIIGGAFKVVEHTGAFEAAIRAGVTRMAGARWLVVPVSMLIFSIGGAVFGLGEEIIPFVLLMVPMVQALGYHPMVGVAIPLIGSQVGFAGAMINPFTVGIAQGIAELPPLSGWQYRTLIWLLVTFVGIVYVERRSRSLKRSDDENTDGAAAHSEEAREIQEQEPAQPLEARHVRVLAVLALGIGVMLWGVQEYQWYVLEIGAVFLAIGVAAGVVGRLSANGIAEGFVAGARDLVSAALVVGTARGIVVLAQKVGILDTVLYGVAGALEGLPGVVALNLMFLFQTCLNFFIPSGSGQAALTMPIMVPLAELVGLTRQMSVLAFQLGDGFSNIIIPTSAVLMGSLEAGKVPYERWFAFVWPLQVILLGCGVLALVGAVAIGFGP